MNDMQQASVLDGRPDSGSEEMSNSPAANKLKKRSLRARLSKSDRGDDNSTGINSKESDFPASNREGGNTVRTWKGIALGLFGFSMLEMFAIASLAVAVAGLTPLKEVQPVIGIIDRTENKVFHFETLEQDTPSWNLATEVMACEYVIRRNTIIPSYAPLVRSWWPGGWIELTSSDAVWEAFEDEANRAIKVFEENNWVRLVVIETDPILQDELDGYRYYRVDFRTEDYDREVLNQPGNRTIQPIQVLHHTANLEITFDKKRSAKSSDRYVNLQGFVTTDYGSQPSSKASRLQTTPAVDIKEDDQIACGREHNREYLLASELGRPS